MKRILLILIIPLCFMSYAQKKKVKQIHSKQSFVLYPQISMSGPQRIYLPIQLPQHTVHWSYVVTTTKSQRNVGMSLFRTVADYYTAGTYSIAENMLNIPPGEVTCNVVLLSQNNINNFIHGGRYSYETSGSRMSYRGGYVKNTWPTQGLWYLGFENPHQFTKVIVHVEVIATIKKPRKPSTVEQIIDILNQPK